MNRLLYTIDSKHSAAIGEGASDMFVSLNGGAKMSYELKVIR